MAWDQHLLILKPGSLLVVSGWQIFGHENIKLQIANGMGWSQFDLACKTMVSFSLTFMAKASSAVATEV